MHTIVKVLLYDSKNMLFNGQETVVRWSLNMLNAARLNSLLIQLEKNPWLLNNEGLGTSEKKCSLMKCPPRLYAHFPQISEFS